MHTLDSLPMLSKHARNRAKQRGVSQEDILIVLKHGKPRRSYGCWRFCLTDRAVRNTSVERRIDELRGLTVIRANDGIILTVLWDWRVKNRPRVLSRSNIVARKLRHRRFCEAGEHPSTRNGA